MSTSVLSVPTSAGTFSLAQSFTTDGGGSNSRFDVLPTLSSSEGAYTLPVNLVVANVGRTPEGNVSITADAMLEPACGLALKHISIDLKFDSDLLAITSERVNVRTAAGAAPMDPTGGDNCSSVPSGAGVSDGVLNEPNLPVLSSLPPVKMPSDAAALPSLVDDAAAGS